MKKRFQILSFAITVIFFSCGMHNADVAGTMPTAIKELLTNSSSLSNETDLLLIDIDGQLRFNIDYGDQVEKLHHSSPGIETTYIVNRSGVAKTMSPLNEFFLVN